MIEAKGSINEVSSRPARRSTRTRIKGERSWGRIIHAVPPAAYLDQRLHLRLDAFTREQLDQVRALFVHDNPELKKWKAFQYGQFAPKEFVSTWKQTAGYLHVPRGRLDEVLEVLDRTAPEKQAFVGSMLDDRRVPGRMHEFTLKGLERRDYQERLVDVAVKRETCLWRAPTASGKTSGAFRFIEEVGTWSLVVVPNRALLDQWAKRVQENFGFKPGIVQGAKKSFAPITIALQPSLLGVLDEAALHFGALICDEVQLFAAKTFNEVVESIPSRYRLGISADEKRSDGKEYLLYDQFGALLPEATVDRSILLEQGAVCDVAVRLVPTDFRADWYAVLEPDAKFLKRAELIEQMTNDADRNATIVACAEWCLQEQEQVAVLSARREHCEVLDGLITQLTPTGRLLGGARDHGDFTESLKRFASGEVKAVVGTYAAIGVGFESHRRLARGVFATPLATQDTVRMQFMQYLGRFARAAPGKTHGLVYVPFDPHVHGDRPVRLIRKWVSDCQVLDRRTGQFVSATQFLKGFKSEKAIRRLEKQQPEQHDDLFQRRPRGG